MDDLISRAAAIEAILGSFNAIRAIEELHAVDAVPVVHGRWISKSEEGRYGPTYCSICDFELRIDDMPYCPMCGAKMDEEVGT